FAALGTDADWPLDRRVGANLAFPIGVYLGEIVGEQKGRAGAIRAVDHDDRLRRQLHIGIELRECGVVPGFDLTEADLREGRTIDAQLAGLDALEIHDRHYAAHHGRELGEAILVEFLTLEWHITRTERDGPSLDLLDAAARANRLIVQSNAGLFL